MKKMYFAPEMEVLELELLTVLAASGGGDVTEEDYELIGDDGESGAIAE